MAKKNTHLVVKQEGFEEDLVVSVWSDYREADKEIKRLNKEPANKIDNILYIRKVVPFNSRLRKLLK